jgi:hypothetical protein
MASVYADWSGCDTAKPIHTENLQRLRLIMLLAAPEGVLSADSVKILLHYLTTGLHMAHT